MMKMKKHVEVEMKCDVCGRSLMYKKKDGEEIEVVGFRLNITDNILCELPDFMKEIKDMFGKTEFNICFVCWIKSLGIKPKEEI